MALVNQDLVLDVVPGVIPKILHLTEYDENMEVVVTLMQRGQPFQIPTDTTAKIEGTLKGHPFSEDGTTSGNTVTFMVSKNMTAYSGRAWTKIKLTKDGKPVSTCGFWLDCDRAGVESDTVIGAPGFEEQITNAVDDWLDEHGGITVDDTLSRQGVAADAKAVGDEVASLNSRIDGVQTATNIYYSGNSSDRYVHVKTGIATASGDKVYYKKVVGSISPRLFGYNGNNGDLIKSLSDEETIQINAAYEELRVVYDNTSQTSYQYEFMLAKLDNESMSGMIANLMLTQATEATQIEENATAIAQNTQDIERLKNSGSQSGGAKPNEYEGIELISGRVYDGVFSDSATTLHCTDYISLIPGHIYAIYGGFFDAPYSNYFDKNKVYKGALPLTNLINTYPYDVSSNHLIFTAPSDAAYTRVNFLNSGLVNGNELQDGWYFRDITNVAWAQKRVLVLGDSISTDVYGGYKKWVTDLIEEGFFTRGLTTNDSHHATGFVATYNSNAETTFINRLQTHTASDFDALIIFGGINDYIQNINFGTFKTAVDTFFSYVSANYYRARVSVLLPLRTSTTTANSAGHIQQDYGDYIKQVAKSYALPILNLTEESGFYPFVEAFKNQWTLLPDGYSAHDGVHPTEEWERDFLVPMVKKFLNGLY